MCGKNCMETDRVGFIMGAIYFIFLLFVLCVLAFALPLAWIVVKLFGLDRDSSWRKCE